MSSSTQRKHSQPAKFPAQFEWGELCFLHDETWEVKEEKVEEMIKANPQQQMQEVPPHDNLHPFGRFLLHAAACFGIINVGCKIFYKEKSLGHLIHHVSDGYCIIATDDMRLHKQHFFSVESLVNAYEIDLKEGLLNIHFRLNNGKQLSFGEVQQAVFEAVTQQSKDPETVMHTDKLASEKMREHDRRKEKHSKENHE